MSHSTRIKFDYQDYCTQKWCLVAPKALFDQQEIAHPGSKKNMFHWIHRYIHNNARVAVWEPGWGALQQFSTPQFFFGLWLCFEKPRENFLGACSHGKWSSQVRFRLLNAKKSKNRDSENDSLVRSGVLRWFLGELPRGLRRPPCLAGWF